MIDLSQVNVDSSFDVSSIKQTRQVPASLVLDFESKAFTINKTIALASQVKTWLSMPVKDRVKTLGQVLDLDDSIEQEQVQNLARNLHSRIRPLYVFAYLYGKSIKAGKASIDSSGRVITLEQGQDSCLIDVSVQQGQEQVQDKYTFKVRA